MTTTPPHPALTVHCPEDLLAFAPAALGFWPHESIVMLTFGADRTFHARLDLPPLEVQDTAVRRRVADVLLEPARRLGARGIVWLYFTADQAGARAVHVALVRACRWARIEVVGALVADGREYAELGPGGGVGPPASYDVTAHPFVLDALVSGRLAHGSREEMAASLELDEALAAPVLDALHDSGLLDAGAPPSGREVRTQGRWVEATVARAVRDRVLPRPGELARLLWVIQVPRVRDAALALLDRAGAGGHVWLWTEVLRRAPDPVAAAPAALLGWAAWQAGNGALAWAALGRCERTAPSYPLAEHLGDLLEQAVPPELWAGGLDWTLGLPPERGHVQ